MVFTVNIGNTLIDVGVVTDNAVLFVERISTDPQQTDLEYAMIFQSIAELHQISWHEIQGSILASVVPPLTDTVSRAILKLMKKQPLIVSPGIKTGLNIRIDDPAQLGSDMVVNAVAAIQEYPLPLILVDLGTATTFSVINQNSEYIGGAIVPGVRVALDALVTRTSQLPRIGFEEPQKVIGVNTIECMRSGVVLGAASMVDGMIYRMEQELQASATVVATASSSCAILPHCNHEILYDDTLPLKGLYFLYQKNC